MSPDTTALEIPCFVSWPVEHHIRWQLVLLAIKMRTTFFLYVLRGVGLIECMVCIALVIIVNDIEVHVLVLLFRSD